MSKSATSDRRWLRAPATKKAKLIKDFKAELNARLLSFEIYINATSTPQQKNRIRTHPQALASNSQLRTIPEPAIIASMCIQAVGWR